MYLADKLISGLKKRFFYETKAAKVKGKCWWAHKLCILAELYITWSTNNCLRFPGSPLSSTEREECLRQAAEAIRSRFERDQRVSQCYAAWKDMLLSFHCHFLENNLFEGRSLFKISLEYSRQALMESLESERAKQRQRLLAGLAQRKAKEMKESADWWDRAPPIFKEKTVSGIFAALSVSPSLNPSLALLNNLPLSDCFSLFRAASTLSPSFSSSYIFSRPPSFPFFAFFLHLWTSVPFQWIYY